LGPVFGDAPSVLPKERVGCYELADASLRGESGSDCAEEGPVVVVECWPVDLSAEHAELVAQHDDFEVFAASGTDRETGQGGDDSIQNAVHETSGSVDVFPGQPPRPNIRPRQAEYCVVPGEAAFWYRFMSPSHRVDFTT
jgi:hypothetical protein